ncbi:MAG: MBL fold metallo-hydrolase [archaeon]|nr:MBL fold metallo-hydrolase [archaeon]
MVITKTDKMINDNTYIFDGKFMNISRFLSVYIIENEGMRIMIDTPQKNYVRKFLKLLQELELYPIHKIILTHSHVDHIGGATRMKKMIKDVDVEIMASKNAIENLKNPAKMNEIFGFIPNSVETVTSLNDGDIIDVNGLELKIFNLFGHTMDSIGILDTKNRNLYPGDAIMIRWNNETFIPTFFPPDFHEHEYLNTFQKLKDIRSEYDSISLPHFGTHKNGDVDKILDEMVELYLRSKEAFINWHKSELTIEEITLKYCEVFLPNSKKITKEKALKWKMIFKWLIESLELSGFI